MAVARSLTIIGLGYVGLPLAQEACRSGLAVAGLDVSNAVVDGLNAGVSHVDDLDEGDVAEMLRTGFTATTDTSCLATVDAVVICVPTPLSDDGTPDLSAVESAAKTTAGHLRPGTLVVLESTTYPGTTGEFVRPILEEGSGLVAGEDFHLAYSPERIDPGNERYGLRNTPKVVGGLTARCTDVAVEFYSGLVDEVVPTVGLREAELAKLLENTYRHVNIALMNEMAVFCHELGIDLWASIEAAKTKPFGFHAFYPGPGVGGHCIPIDPNYLSWVVRSLGYRFRFVELAQEVSERMPAYVAKRIQDALNGQKKAVNGSRIVLVGVSYKADVSDVRETPARPLAAQLQAMGADLLYLDPHVPEFRVDGESVPAMALDATHLDQADLVVVLQPHTAVLESGVLECAPAILDTSGSLDGHNVERL
ncbi:MAG: UDP-N-acetyl-D-glucosamine dehydrogenase [Rhodospirillaceae bacterium]|nr:UDP-N-acetyl-D-glucosamine dehydrogenase [Rhodospirillaceae bacterium]